jgi:hypothetical protein
MNVPVADLAALVLIVLLAVLVIRWTSDPQLPPSVFRFTCGLYNARRDVICTRELGHDGPHEGELAKGWSLLWP